MPHPVHPRNSRASRPAAGASLVGASLVGACLLGGCAFVQQRDREYLSDRIMQRQDDALESALESHDFPRREGSVGGSSGSGGGCGC